jgi:hypothetical protein
VKTKFICLSFELNNRESWLLEFCLDEKLRKWQRFLWFESQKKLPAYFNLASTEGLDEAEEE